MAGACCLRAVSTSRAGMYVPACMRLPCRCMCCATSRVPSRTSPLATLLHPRPIHPQVHSSKMSFNTSKSTYQVGGHVAPRHVAPWHRGA